MGLTVFLVACNLATLILSILTIIQTSRLWKLWSVRWLMIVSAIIFFAAFFSLNVYIAQTLEEKILFFKLRILGTLFLAPCWFYFIGSVFDRWQWMKKKWVMVVIFIPCVLNFLLMINPSTQSLLFTDYSIFHYRDASLLKFKCGPAYTYFYSWSMALMLLSYVLSGITFVKNKARRSQVLFLNVGLAVAIAQNMVADYSKNPEGAELVASALTYLFTEVAIIYTVLRHRLLSIVPLAMERIFHELPDPVFVIDEELRIMGVSEKGKEIFSLPKKYLGKSFQDLLPHIPLVAGEISFTAKDQKKYFFHLALEEVGDDNHRSSGTVVFFRDIGEQKIVEERLHEGIEFRARLLALLAHDLSGFVAAQSLIVTSLQEHMGPEHDKYFQLLESSSMASHNLIDNVLGWVKNQSMQLQPITKSFEWNMLVEETLTSIESRFNMKGVEVIKSSNSRQIIADGDSEMMASVLRNILLNALRSTDSGKKITIDLKAHQNHVELKIRDEGHGMSKEELEKLLEDSKEFSLSGVSKRHGAGIGLMLVRHFVSLHRGEFSMFSIQGKGTEVLISIPF